METSTWAQCINLFSSATTIGWSRIRQARSGHIRADEFTGVLLCPVCELCSRRSHWQTAQPHLDWGQDPEASVASPRPRIWPPRACPRTVRRQWTLECSHSRSRTPASCCFCRWEGRTATAVVPALNRTRQSCAAAAPLCRTRRRRGLFRSSRSTCRWRRRRSKACSSSGGRWTASAAPPPAWTPWRPDSLHRCTRRCVRRPWCTRPRAGGARPCQTPSRIPLSWLKPAACCCWCPPRWSGPARRTRALGGTWTLRWCCLGDRGTPGGYPRRWRAESCGYHYPRRPLPTYCSQRSPREMTAAPCRFLYTRTSDAVRKRSRVRSV